VIVHMFPVLRTGGGYLVPRSFGLVYMGHVPR